MLSGANLAIRVYLRLVCARAQNGLESEALKLSNGSAYEADERIEAESKMVEDQCVTV